MAVITIKHYLPLDFDTYTVVQELLHSTYVSGGGTAALLQTSGGGGAFIVRGTGFQFDASGYLVAGIVSEIEFYRGGEIVITASGLALDMAEAEAAYWNGVSYPLDPNPTFNYDASAVPPDDGWGIYFDSGSGNDTIVGTQGHDDLAGFEGHDSILGLGGEDYIWGGLGNDTVRGGEDSDEIFGGSDSDELYGDGGDDLIMGGSGWDLIDGGDGMDIADFRDAAGKIVVTLNGAQDAAVFVAGGFADTIRNIEGVYGGDFADKLTGDALKNSFMGGGGKDTIDGGRGTDMALYFDKTSKVEVKLNGSTQVSVKVGGKVEDKIKNIEHVVGGAAGDKLTGDSKGNLLVGLGGKDQLTGGAGNDTLHGGEGRDVLEGGSGRDTFWFDDPVLYANRDTIKDFGGKDEIVLDSWYFGALGPTVTSNEFRKGTAARDADDFLIYNKANGKLYYDADGSGAGAQVEIAVLSNKPNLSASDFEIV